MQRVGFMLILAAALLAACALQQAGTGVRAATPTFATTPIVGIRLPTVVPSETSAKMEAISPETVTPTQTSSPLASQAEGSFLKIEMFDETSGWALAVMGESATERLLRTDDGASTWEDVSPPDEFMDYPAPMTVIPFFASATKAWVVYSENIMTHGAYPLRVWRTKNGGSTWDVSSPGFGLGGDDTPEQMDFIAERGWLMVTQPGMSVHGAYIAYTADEGVSWKSLGRPDSSFEDGRCTKVYMVFRSASVGWVVGDCNTGIYFKKTSDGGKTWMPQPLPPPAAESGSYLLSKPEFPPAVRGTEWVAFLLSSFYPEEGWLYSSSDGGESWRASRLPKPFGVATFINSSVGWFAGSDKYDPQQTGEASVYGTSNGGQTWTLLTRLPSVAQLNCVSEQVCWAVTGPFSSGVLRKTIDGGATWTETELRVNP